MPFEIDYIPHEDIVYIAYNGPITYKDLVESAEQGIRIAREYDCFKILVSGLAGTEATEPSEYFQLPDLYKELDIPKTVRIALLVKPLNIGNADFYVNLVRNRGWNARFFFDRHQALNWLRK